MNAPLKKRTSGSISRRSAESSNFTQCRRGRIVFSTLRLCARNIFALILYFSPLTASAQQQKVVSCLEVFDIKTRRHMVLRQFPYIIEAPNWTRDGKWIVYNSQGKLFRIRANGKGEPQVINTGELTNCNNDHVLSSGNRLLAVSNHDQSDFQSRVYVLPLEGGVPRRVTPNGPSYLHGWSPDGTTLAYCAYRNNQWDIYTIPSEGGEETRLTTAAGLDDGPEYSPDGRHIWFNSSRTGEMQLWRMNADGSQQTQMTFDSRRNAWFPHVSPNGQWVVWLAYRRDDIAPDQHLPNYLVELLMMPAEGGEHTVLTTLFGGQGTLNVNSWAPDSRRFCYVSYRLQP
ncbi:MAG: PD40 domain-containing protein [Prevotella sp.]|nr:PD40 domain-containing protein [Prevotella sp.]